eukprot:scpid72293/ scgid18956/ Thiopurine S-methyltransferase; Thiopurine methyltransferase
MGFIQRASRQLAQLFCKERLVMSSSQKPDLDWESRWKDGRTGWHRDEVNDRLIQYHGRLLEGANAEKKLNVFVPLCGKTVDMLWLNEQGHHISGVDLVRQALDDFVSENKLTSTVSSVKNGDGEEVTLIKAGENDCFSLFPSDLFKVDCTALGQVDAAWDRGSYVALSPEIRPRYAENMAAVIKPGGRVLMEVYDYVQSEHAGPPFSTPNDEITSAFGKNFTIEIMQTEDALDYIKLRFPITTRFDRSMVLLVRKAN